MKIKFTSPIVFSCCAFLIAGYLDMIIILHGGLYDFLTGTVLTQLFSMVMFILFLIILEKKGTSGEYNLFAFCLFLITFCLQSASAVCYPRQADRSNWSLEKITVRQDNFLMQTILFFGIFLAVSFLLRFDRIIDKNIKKIVWLTSIINLFFGGYFVINGGQTATIGGLVVGLPLLAWMLFSFSAYHTFYRYSSCDGSLPFKNWSTYEKITTIGIFVSSLLLIMGFIRTHEYGILFYFFLSVIAWIFFEPHETIFTLKKKTIWYGTGILVVILSIMMAYVSYSFYKSAYDRALAAGELSKNEIEIYVSQLSFIHHFGSKVARIFLNTGLKFIRSAGLFGSSEYVYDIAANNDYAVGLQIHNIGLIWLFILVVLMILFCTTGSLYLSSNNESTCTSKTLRSLCFFCILALIVYPISSNIGLTAIIGVSAYCAGYSGMHTVLCASLMASVLHERR